MSLNWNNVKPACCAKWLVLPTVYSDALSYGEQLDKFCYQLNQLIENNNILPDFIAEIIKEYINSGAIGEVVRDILANYILNVKYPPEGITPAVGDGSEDDTEAIQGCINYAAENGGVVYFPYGAYLTQPLELKSGVSLFSFDRYSARIVCKAGATKPLLSGNVAEVTIANLTLDGNSGVQVNNIDVVDISGRDVLMSNLVVEDGYNLLKCNMLYDNSVFQMDNVVFGSAVERVAVFTGKGKFKVDSTISLSLSLVSGVEVYKIECDKGDFNLESIATCPVCVNVSGNGNCIKLNERNGVKSVVDNGVNNNVVVCGESSSMWFRGGVELHAGKVRVVASDNVSVNAVGLTETVTGDKVLTANNYSETITENKRTTCGNLTEHIKENRELDVDGTDSVHVDGASTFNVGGVRTEIYASNRNIDVAGTNTETYGNSNETYNGKRVINEKDVAETATGKKEINAKDIVLNPINPLTYRTPTKLNEEFDSVPFKDANGNVYNVLVSSNRPKHEINVDDFGAVGDGITNDRNAIANAIAEANVSGAKVVFSPEKTYKIEGDKIETKTSIDFRGATIVLSESDFIEVVPTESVDITITNNDLEALRVKKQELFGKCFKIESPIVLDKRNGTGFDVHHTQVMVTDGNGYFVNSRYFTSIIKGEYICTNVHSLEKELTFENAIVVYTGKTCPYFVSTKRSMCTVRNVHVTSTISSQDYIKSVLSAFDCAFIRWENVGVYNPVLNPASGYLYGAGYVSDLVMNNCVGVDASGDSWGAVGISGATNLTVTNCTLNRFDTHYEMIGRYYVNACSLRVIKVCLGWGTYTVSNCNFYRNATCIEARDDVPFHYSGIFTVERCRFDNFQKVFTIVGSRQYMVDTKQLGFYNCIFMVKDCTVNRILYFRTEDDTRRNLTMLVVKNCLDTSTDTVCDVDKIKSAMFIDCVGSQLNSIGQYEKLFFINCTLNALKYASDSEYYKVVGCHLPHVSIDAGHSQPSVFEMSNNILTGNIARGVKGEDAEILTGNVSKTMNENNLASWNTIPLNSVRYNSTKLQYWGGTNWIDVN